MSFFFYLYTTVKSENFSDYTLLWAHWKYSYLRRHAFEFLLLLGRWGLCPEGKYKNMFSGKNVVSNKKVFIPKLFMLYYAEVFYNCKKKHFTITVVLRSFRFRSYIYQ